MTERELKRLNRIELMQLLLEQAKEAEWLQAQLDAANNKINSLKTAENQARDKEFQLMDRELADAKAKLQKNVAAQVEQARQIGDLEQRLQYFEDETGKLNEELATLNRALEAAPLQSEIDSRERELDFRENGLNEKERELDSREYELNEREETLNEEFDDRSGSLDRREKNIADLEIKTKRKCVALLLEAKKRAGIS